MGDFCFFAFRVPPQKETAARSILKKRGFSVCVPMQRVTRRSGSRGRSGPRETYKKPAVPGYVFVYLSALEPELYRLFRFQIVKSVVGFNGQPGRIAPESMAAFLRKLGERPKEITKTTFAKGSVVRIKEGAFVGFEAVVEEVKGECASVLTSLFGRPTPLKIAVEHLEIPAPKRRESHRGATRRASPAQVAAVPPV